MGLVKLKIGEIALNDYPIYCPNCHRSITPDSLYGHINRTEDLLEVMFSCPDAMCNEAFLAKYNIDSRNGCDFTGITSKGNLIGKKFSRTINLLSPSFILIYNESYIAEQEDLKEICGVGYRKALEFLIKDYIIINKPEEKEKVEKKLLGACIAEYVDDARIKSVAKRAVWLGNDETHYVKKWEGKNLEDMKKLIDLTIHWIEMEALTHSFEDDMPE